MNTWIVGCATGTGGGPSNHQFLQDFAANPKLLLTGLPTVRTTYEGAKKR